jgi:hypothetical protein
VGEAGREVNHDLIAAGHPPLIFEMDAYLANMPPHWHQTQEDEAMSGAYTWAVGQAVSLRQSLELLVDRAKRGALPEFAELECYSCHHALRDKSWRQEIGYGDRRPGTPLWSNSPLQVAMRWAVSAGSNRTGAAEYLALQKLMAEPSTPVSEIAAAAGAAAAAATTMVDQVAREHWNRNRLEKLILDLSVAPSAGSLDYATAAYTTMALGAIVEAMARSHLESGSPATQWTSKVRARLDRLYDDVQQPELFDAQKFMADLESFRSAIQP